MQKIMNVTAVGTQSLILTESTETTETTVTAMRGPEILVPESQS